MSRIFVKISQKILAPKLPEAPRSLTDPPLRLPILFTEAESKEQMFLLQSVAILLQRIVAFLHVFFTVYQLKNGVN